MADIIADLTATTIEQRLDAVREEREVMSHVFYGRGWPRTVDETIANVVVSYREAEEAYGGKVWLVWDGEDTGFGAEDSELERLFDQPITGDTMALLAWWESYGYASGEEAEPLRKRVGELCKLDYRHLTECQ